MQYFIDDLIQKTKDISSKAKSRIFIQEESTFFIFLYTTFLAMYYRIKAHPFGLPEVGSNKAEELK
jgi:hypothetical protein